MSGVKEQVDLSSSQQAEVELWPCRIEDAGAPQVMVCRVGAVKTAMQQGVFDPETDRFVGDAGASIEHYFTERLGICYFTPLTKTTNLPMPSGWCSWMYYGRDVTPEEVLVNARWIADHLRDYGVSLIQIDDGWQADGRNWEGCRETFPQGMAWLADEIRKLGLLPGLWICPHGQDNAEFVQQEGCFITCDTFGGPYTVDTTRPEGIAYLHRLMKRLIDEWGYGYLKLDGVYSRGNTGYGANEGYIRHHSALADPTVTPVEAFRRYLGAVKDGVGAEAMVGGCGILAYDAVGVCDGQRAGADVDAEWDKGFLNAVQATMRGYFLHRLGWFNDPDCCLLRPPLSFGMAQAWVTLMGLTGQMLLFGDRMPDLGAERINMLKKILPVGDVRPFDLFPATTQKPIIDLKVDQLGRSYDVVGVFNYHTTQGQMTHLRFADLGLPEDTRCHVYDFWTSDYLGVYSTGVFLDVPAASCRVVTLYPAGDFPVLLSTNRHILQGWPDVEALEIDTAHNRIAGVSRVIAGEPYTLVFALPNDDMTTFQLDSASLDNEDTLSLAQGRGDARLSWIPSASGTVAWEAHFSRQPINVPFNASSYPYMLGAHDIDPWTVELFWVSFGSPNGYFVKQDGKLLGYTFDNRCRISGLEYGSIHTYTVGVADLTGRQFAKTEQIEVRVGETLPAALYLSDLAWESATTGYMVVRADKSVGGASLSTAGRRYRKGIGTHPGSKIVYHLHGNFTRLSGAFGIEDQNGISGDMPAAEKGQALFSIIADGRCLLPPTRKIHGETPAGFNVDITGVQVLELIVERPADTGKNLAPHANWLDVQVSRTL